MVGKGRGGERKYIYQKGYQHGQAIQLLSVIMLHNLRVTVCVCSEGSALFHIKTRFSSFFHMIVSVSCLVLLRITSSINCAEIKK